MYEKCASIRHSPCITKAVKNKADAISSLFNIFYYMLLKTDIVVTAGGHTEML